MLNAKEGINMSNPRTTWATVGSNKEDAQEILELKKRLNSYAITDEQIFRRGIKEIIKERESIAI